MISLILTLAVVGMIVWAITTYIPMDPMFRTIIYVVVAVFLIVWLMGILGVSDIPVPRLR